MSKVKIGDITTSCLGKMLDAEKNKGEYEPYLANINVRWGSFELDNLQMMKFEPSEQERYKVLDGDLIMCEGGEPGRCAIWRSELSEIKIQKALHRIRAKEGTDIEYLYYWFLHAGRNHLIDGYFTGSTIKHLPGDKLKLIELDIPDYITQKRTSRFLSKIDEKIKNNTSICSALESMAKLLYDYWFVQFDFPDENGKPYKSSGGKMVWNEELKREIPEGWEVKKLRNVAVYVSDKITSALLTKDTYVGTDNLLSDMKGRTVSEYVPTEGYSTAYEENDILIANIRPYFKKIWQSDSIGGASADVLVIRTEKEIGSWVYSTLARDDFFAYDMAGTKGSKMPRGDKDHIMNYPIPYSEQIIKRFSSKISHVNELRNYYYHENQQLASLRDFLLPMLMNGQVKVGKAGELYAST